MALTTPLPAPIDDFDVWLAGFMQPTVWVELAALSMCMLAAWGLSSLLRKLLGMQDEMSTDELDELEQMIARAREGRA